MAVSRELLSSFSFFFRFTGFLLPLVLLRASIKLKNDKPMLGIAADPSAMAVCFSLVAYLWSKGVQSLFPSSIPPGIQPHVRICVVDHNAIHRVFHWADDMGCVMVLLYLSFALPFVALLHCFSHVLHMFLFSYLASIAHLRYKNKNYWCITDEDCIAQGKLIYTAALPTAVRCVSVFFRLTFFFILALYLSVLSAVNNGRLAFVAARKEGGAHPHGRPRCRG